MAPSRGNGFIRQMSTTRNSPKLAGVTRTRMKGVLRHFKIHGIMESSIICWIFFVWFPRHDDQRVQPLRILISRIIFEIFSRYSVTDYSIQEIDYESPPWSSQFRKQCLTLHKVAWEVSSRWTACHCKVNLTVQLWFRVTGVLWQSYVLRIQLQSSHPVETIATWLKQSFARHRVTSLWSFKSFRVVSSTGNWALKPVAAVCLEECLVSGDSSWQHKRGESNSQYAAFQILMSCSCLIAGVLWTSNVRSILADSLEGFVDALPKFTLAGKKLPRSITGIDGNQSFHVCKLGFP